MGMNRYDVLEHIMCKEVEMLEKKYEEAKGEMTIEDLKKLDLLYHTLKSKATYDAMKDAEEYGYEQSQMSGRRGYSRMSGHWPEGPEYYTGTPPYPPRPHGY